MYSENATPTGGCGYAKNRAIQQSHGEYLCFQDADDIMYPDRITKELEVLRQHPDSIVGTRFESTLFCVLITRRTPQNSMRHYTEWLNNLQDEDLMKYQYREVIIIQPTWMLSRKQFDRVGGYRERGSDEAPFPEVGSVIVVECRIWISITAISTWEGSCTLFQRCWSFTGALRVNGVTRRMHPNNACSKVPRRTILRVKLQALERRVLDGLDHFCIWGGGRDGRNFLNDLSEENRKKVVVFGDVDTKKVGAERVIQRRLALTT